MRAKLPALLIALVLACTAAACDKGGSGAAGEVEIWSTYATEKVMRTGSYEKGAAEFYVAAYGNETEAGQIVLTPEKDVKSYTVEAAELTAGENKLPASCFTVYHEKYVEVTRATTDFPLGWYPDALLPMAAAAEYGENTIAAGENQAVYIAVTVPAGQPAGTYTGQFKVECDGQTYYIPATVEVWDWSLPEENHLRTVFSVQQSWGEGALMTGELDSTWEMYEKYYDFLREYRICTRYLPYSNNGTWSDPDKFIEEALEATADPMITTYVLPYVSTATGIDMEYYDALIEKMMAASIENGVDLFEKCVTYFAIFDEANNDPSKIKLANTVLAAVRDHNAALAKRFETDFADYKAEQPQAFDALVASMVDVVQLYVDEDEGKLNDGLNETYCPTVMHYSAPSERQIYLDHNPDERWWYTCVSPTNPYPSYHIDDWLYSARIMSWMQYKYGVVGNLYWSTVYWLDPSGSVMQDAYGNAMHFPNVNGDGFLLYPGKYYGIDGPVGSLRLHAIRDGMEDYEALLALDETTVAALKNTGLTSRLHNVYDVLYDTMFSGTVVRTDSAQVEAARYTVAAMLEAAASGAVLYDCVTDGSTRTFYVYAPAGTTVEAEGATASEAAGGTVYAIVCDNSKEGAALAYTVVEGGERHTVSLSLGSKRIATDSAALLAGMTFNAGDEGEATDAGLQLQFAASDKTQYAVYRASDFSAWDLEKAILSFTVDYQGELPAKFMLYVRGTKSQTTYSAFTTSLNAGANEIRVNLYSMLWSEIGDISYLRFTFETPDNGAFTATIRDFVRIE